ncbi:MAG: trigger factor [Lachnospiraceae bacterium]|nr:trigger factor [Lachnospiraceae bacterium]
MSLQYEKLDHNMAKLTLEASAEELEQAIERAYQKSKGKISVAGFRKGKVPRKVIERFYGKDVFYQDAAEDLVPRVYERETKDYTELDIVSRPRLSVEKIESGEPLVFTAEVALKPPVELGKYKGLNCTAINTDVTEDEVNEELEKQRQNNARIVDVEDRPVQDKDFCILDYEGVCEGEAFEGGKAEDYNLLIGSHTFIDTFEDQLIGHSIGESFDVDVTFPEDYHAENLKGKPATFHVTIKNIREKQLSDLDDEFASEVSDFDTLEEYKEDIRKKIHDRKDNEARGKKEDELVLQIINDSKMNIPEAMIETQGEDLLQEFAYNIQSRGMSFQTYMQYTGQTQDQMMKHMKERAERNIQSRLVLEAVADAEGITVEDEVYEAELDKMAHDYNMGVDRMKEIMGKKELQNIRKNLAIQKAVDFILDNAVETEPEAKENKE